MSQKTSPTLKIINAILLLAIGLAIFELLGLTYSFSESGAQFSFAAALKNFSA